MAVLLLLSGTVLARASSVNSLNPLFQTVPASDFGEVPDWIRIRTESEAFSRIHGVFSAKDASGSIIWIVFHLVSPGYDGPLDLLVALTNEGTVEKVNVFRHTETDCHVVEMTSGRFLRQFEKVSLREKLTLLIGIKPSKPGEIHAMTDGTITSKAVFEAVAEARLAFHRLFMDQS